jgi:hypothetical protein
MSPRALLDTKLSRFGTMTRVTVVIRPLHSNFHFLRFSPFENYRKISLMAILLTPLTELIFGQFWYESL